MKPRGVSTPQGGATKGNRTPDPRLKRPLLYRLSYGCIWAMERRQPLHSGVGLSRLSKERN